jgi:RNA polymerase sigma factor (sigma-70 family)
VDEVREFCRRVLGPGQQADEAAAQAVAEISSGQLVELLGAAADACRERAERGGRGERAEGAGAGPPPQATPPSGNGDADPATLAQAVARELAAATAALPERQREVLALRELLRLSYADIAEVMEIDSAAVAPLLARSRLRLRTERRGPHHAGGECAESDRALRALALKQDAESLGAEEADWLATHLGSCQACGVAHAAMLEASVCYRAWPGSR